MTTPPQHSGPQCEQRLARGSVSYPCRLPHGHHDLSLEPADPEPCFADEVPQSGREWRAWRDRRQGASVVHSCGGRLRLAEGDRGPVVCTGCDFTADVVAEATSPDPGTAVAAEMAAAFSVAGAGSRRAMESRAARRTDRPPPGRRTTSEREPVAGPYSIGSGVWPGLAKAAEEAGELVQVVGKLIASGGQPGHWDGTDLVGRLGEEVADLQAALEFLVEANHLDREAVGLRRAAKLSQFRDWHDRSRGGAPS